MPGPAEQGEKGALMQTLRVCVRSPGGRAPLAPADGVPVWRSAPEQEGPPALPYPPQPPCAGGSRQAAPAAVRPTLVVLPGGPDLSPSMGAAVLGPSRVRRGGAATPIHAAGSWARTVIATSSPAARLVLPGPCAATRVPGPASRLPCMDPEGRSPLGQSPAMRDIAGELAEGEPRPQRQGGRVLAGSRRLRAAPPPLTPKPRQSARILGGWTASMSVAQGRTLVACRASLDGEAPASVGTAPVMAERRGCAPATRSTSCQPCSVG